ncbi:MAG: 30S ribosomal protein S16 [Nitrospira sp.]|nr:30S ribosomal protein S16 [Nitrospira sp.]
MAVHLRLARTGRHKRPMYRVVAADSRKARDGRFIEILGIFDPLKETGVPELKQERVLTWLHQGAQPTVTVRTLLRRAGVWKQFEAEKSAKEKAPAEKSTQKKASAKA